MADVIGARVVGSPYTCGVPISENSPVNTSAGAINGILIRRAICQSDAPSIRAAS
jgi:hypothetical protein